MKHYAIQDYFPVFARVEDCSRWAVFRGFLLVKEADTWYADAGYIILHRAGGETSTSSIWVHYYPVDASGDLVVDAHVEVQVLASADLERWL